MAHEIDIPDECREFYRGARRRRLLALTYEFTPALFERAFGHLLDGTAQVDVILGVPGIGARPNYLTWRANWPRTFHPKLLVMIADQKVGVGLGSANLTSNGLQSNLETFDFFGEECTGLLAGVRRFVVRLRKAGVLPRSLDVEEILEALPDGGDHHLPLLSTLDGRLLDLVVQRLRGRRAAVEEIDVISPMYCRFDPVVKALRARLGGPRLTIRTRALGGMPKVEGLAQAYTLQGPSEGRQLDQAHAKVYAFLRGDHADVFWGSANASPSAWLLSAKSRSANIELLAHSRVARRAWLRMRDQHLPEDHCWKPIEQSADLEPPMERMEKARWQLLHGVWSAGRLVLEATSDGPHDVRLRRRGRTPVQARVSPREGEFVLPLAAAARLGFQPGKRPPEEAIEWRTGKQEWQVLPVNAIGGVDLAPEDDLLDSLFHQYLGQATPWNGSESAGGARRRPPDEKDSENLTDLEHEPALDRLVGAWRAVSSGLARTSGGAGTKLHEARVRSAIAAIERDAVLRPGCWSPGRQEFVKGLLWRG